MGYAVRVDSDRVAAQGVGLAEVGTEVGQVAEGLRRILLAMAGAAGSGALGRAAAGAAAQWSDAVGEVAARGVGLGRATEQAAAHYAAVEQRLTGVWSVGGGTRWAP